MSSSVQTPSAGSKLSLKSMTTQQRRVIASTASGFTLENMDIMFLSFSLALIISDFGISKATAGWIGTVTNLGMLVGGVLFGLLGDKIGRVKVFSYTIFIFAIATGLTYFASNIWVLYVLRFLAGIGAGGEYGVGMSMIAENFDRQHVGRLTSLCAIGGQVGAIIAALLAAWILPNWHLLFLTGIVPVILIFFIRRHVKESETFLNARQAARQSHRKISLSRLFATGRLAWQTIGLIIMTIVQIAGYFGLMNWLPTIAQNRSGLSVKGSSLWMIATILGMCLGMVAFGAIMDAFGPRWAFGIFLIGSCVSMYTILFSTNVVALLFAGALVGFCSNGMFGGYGTVISLLYPTEIRSTANNFIMNMGRAIGGFSSVVIGLIMDVTNNNIADVMIFLSSLYIVSFIVMLCLPGIHDLTRERLAARHHA
jgi:MFS family permease